MNAMPAVVIAGIAMPVTKTDLEMCNAPCKPAASSAQSASGKAAPKPESRRGRKCHAKPQSCMDEASRCLLLRMKVA
jgi:hypothetical protein